MVEFWQCSHARLVLRASAALNWLVLCGGVESCNLAAAAVTAVSARWMSPRLLPPRTWRSLQRARAVLHFLRQSVILVRRALDPQLPLKAGFAPHQALCLCPERPATRSPWRTTKVEAECSNRCEKPC